MYRAAALGLLVAGGAVARADSSVAPVGAAAKRRTWGQQCQARFEQARTESIKLEPSFSTGGVVLQAREDVLPLAEEVMFGWQHGKPHFGASVEPLAPGAVSGDWRAIGPNSEQRHFAGHTAIIGAYLSFDADRVKALRALWRDAADDCLHMDAPLPNAPTPWGRACVARFAQARAESAAVDPRFAAGTIDVVVVERVRFKLEVRSDNNNRQAGWWVDTEAESDPDFQRSLDRPLSADGWGSYGFHPNHPFPYEPNERVHRHVSGRTASITDSWPGDSSALWPIWKQAANDCLEKR